MINDPNQFSREAWDANAEHWDARMGEEGNDFFNIACCPVFEFKNLQNLSTATLSGSIPPVFDESSIREGLSGGCGHNAKIPLGKHTNLVHFC